MNDHMSAIEQLCYMEITGEIDLLPELDRESMRYERSKSPTADLITVLIAVLGGAGIGPVIDSVGRAIRNYFRGRTDVDSARKASVSLTVKGKMFTVTAETSSEQMAETLAAVESLLAHGPRGD